ncbi:MAG: PRC-barrel domain-containing protein [Dehalococcoidia bacterium]
MTEREREPGITEEEQRRLEADRIERESIDIGPGLGGGLAPVLPTDLDGQHPDSHWMTTSDERTDEPNWAREEIKPGLETMEPQREPITVSHDTHIVTVFGEDLGRVEEVYGYAPTNEPAWAAIKEGDRKVLVPVMSAQMDDDGLRVPYPKNIIETAPELPERFSLAQEMALYSHYNERRILPAASGDEQEHQRTLHLLSRAA